MRAIGIVLVVVGFLTGSFAAVHRVEGVDAGLYLLAFAVGVFGVTLMRWAAHREARHEETVSTNIEVIGESLWQIVERIDALARDKESIDVYDLRHRIDAEFLEPLDGFVQARQSIVTSFGLEAYADIMNAFAAGERYLNRVWSASTDGYVDEARKYVDRSRVQFRSALEQFERLRDRA